MQVIRSDGCRKDADFIANLHTKLAKDLTDDEPQKLIGVIMDNTKANVAAMKLLEERHPTWLATGCVAHALNLLVKDMGNDSKCPGVARIIKDVLQMALVIGDSAAVRWVTPIHGPAPPWSN
jgi:hypothetical protein